MAGRYGYGTLRNAEIPGWWVSGTRNARIPARWWLSRTRNARISTGGGFPGQGIQGFRQVVGFQDKEHQDSRQVVDFQDRVTRGGFQEVRRGNSVQLHRPLNVYRNIRAYRLFAVDPGAIRGCLYRYTFVWLSRRQGFWFFPVFVGRNSVAGWRWRNRQRRWEYTGISLDQIDRFSCF